MKKKLTSGREQDLHTGIQIKNLLPPICHSMPPPPLVFEKLCLGISL